MIPTIPNYETMAVLADIEDERRRQDEKWGTIQTVPGGDGTGSPRQVDQAIQAKALTDARMANGTDSWCDILSEEVAEAFAERDLVALRAELVQVAAVAVKWSEDIDRRLEAA